LITHQPIKNKNIQTVMKLIASLAMTGVITAAEVDTLLNATPVQLAEFEGLNEMLAQTTCEAGKCYSTVMKNQKNIKDYIAKIQKWIDENKGKNDGKDNSNSGPKPVSKTCDGALNRLFDENKLNLFDDNKNKNSNYKDVSFPNNKDQMYWT
jgi:hypothetical protein